ncbi:MAG: cyclodeaminase/cyclohydrolase family protein, partial [Candidatus Omnitrophota bacterium]
MYINSPIKKYLKDLAAKTPAPGGGSAAALSSALAASLMCMAAQFTLGKEKYVAFAPRAKKILATSSRMQAKLSALLDEDVSAYKNKDMKKAIQVPAQVCQLSYELMGFAVELLERGNKNLATDAGL